MSKLSYPNIPFAGSPSANYNIEPSQLGRPTVHHTLKSASLSASHAPAAVGLNFEISKKDKLVAPGFPNTYRDLIDFLKEMHVVLYDNATKCAWLVDGASAVLHLVRASLQRDLNRVEIFGDDSDFLYRNGDLHEGESLDGPVAAEFVLRNQKNRLTPVHVESLSYHDEWVEHPRNASKPFSKGPSADVQRKFTKTYVHFEKRVLEICTTLEKIVDHFNNKDTDDGINFVLRANAKRGHVLGGFDFIDVANNKGTFSAHETILNPGEFGNGWTALIDAIGAITLFGRNFGDLIKPDMMMGSHACNDCGFGGVVPKGKDYLVARTNHVKRILDDKGNMRTHPWQLVGKLLWRAPEATFEACNCSAGTHSRSCLRLEDRIQVLYRSGRFRKWLNRRRGPKTLTSMDTGINGAMIFGHSFLPDFRQRTQRTDEMSEVAQAEDTIDPSSMSTSSKWTSSGDNGHATSADEHTMTRASSVASPLLSLNILKSGGHDSSISTSIEETGSLDKVTSGYFSSILDRSWIEDILGPMEVSMRHESGARE